MPKSWNRRGAKRPRAPNVFSPLLLARNRKSTLYFLPLLFSSFLIFSLLRNFPRRVFALYVTRRALIVLARRCLSRTSSFHFLRCQNKRRRRRRRRCSRKIIKVRGPSCAWGRACAVSLQSACLPRLRPPQYFGYVECLSRLSKFAHHCLPSFRPTDRPDFHASME